MDHSIFAEISLIIAIAAFVGLIMRLLKQPMIIGYILTGILVGPAVLNIVHSESTFEAFSKIGIALLLFIVGLGINPKMIKELGKVSLVAGTVQILLTSAIGFGVAQMFGYSTQVSMIIGVGLAFSSTIIILKLLSDKKEQSRLYGKIAIGILLVQDVVATIALVVLSASSEGSLELEEFGALALKGLLLALFLGFCSNFIFPRINKLVAGSQEFLFLFALGWGLGIATLFEIAGFSIEVGALFAGVALAPLPYAQEVGARLRPIRDFFVVLFFINIGAQLTLDGASNLIAPILAISFVVIIIKPLIVMITLGFMGYTKNTSMKTGLTMGQISEFSLIFIFLAFQEGFVTQEIITLLTFVALISIAVSTYLIMYSDQIYLFFERNLSMFESRVGKREGALDKYSMVLFGYQKGGSQFIKVFKSLHKKYIVVDYDPEVIDHLSHTNVPYIYGDATDPELLEEVNIEHAKLIVSTVTDHTTNTYLVQYVAEHNSRAVLICHADNPAEASELYRLGATYVLMPHYLGSEKISSFIKRNGFNKAEFKKFREKHLVYLETHGK